MENISNGKQLLIENNLRQGSYFKASEVPEVVRNEWIDFRISENYRKSTKKNNIISSDDIIVIMTQDCDIACSNDSHDPYIECAIFKPIKEKQVHAGNQFAYSVRKLHIKINENWYEAKSNYLTYIEKSSLLHNIQLEEITIEKLEDAEFKIIPYWRANRYLRAALPDNFNASFMAEIEEHKETLKNGFLDFQGKSYIRGIYVKLDTNQEIAQYKFELFFLLKSETPQQEAKELQDLSESISCELVEKYNYSEYEDCIYADKECNTSVAFIINFSRVNFDHLSLSNEDEDIGDNLG